MEKIRYNRLVNDPKTFGVADRLWYAEVQWSSDPSRFHTRRGTMSENETIEWLKGHAQDEPSTQFQGLRLIAYVPSTRSAKRLPLGLSSAAFKAITHHWRLPESLLHLLSMRTSCFLPFETTDDGTTGYAGHVLQTIEGDGRSFTCALSHSASARRTDILVYGLLAHEFDLVYEDLVATPNLSPSPIFLPTCLLDLFSEGIEKNLKRCRTQTHDIKLDLRMGNRVNVVDDLEQMEKKLRSYNFEPVTCRLTGLTVMLAKCELKCEAHLLLLDQLEKEYTKWIDGGGKELEQETRLLHERMEKLRLWLQNLQLQAKYLSKRTQAYVQTVYSFTAQKDNALNKQMAEASLRISKASYRDSAAMKALAEDSKHIAVTTSKDSSYMLIVSTLTLVYLPATFTATMFSTEFFDIKFSSVDGITSSRFWLYWAVTVPLTLTTTAGAWYFWRMRYKKLEKAFEQRNMELSKLVEDSS